VNGRSVKGPNASTSTCLLYANHPVCAQVVDVLPCRAMSRGIVCLHDDSSYYGPKSLDLQEASIGARQKHACPPPSLVSRRRVYIVCAPPRDFPTDDCRGTPCGWSQHDGRMRFGAGSAAEKLRPETQNAFPADFLWPPAAASASSFRAVFVFHERSGGCVD